MQVTALGTTTFFKLTQRKNAIIEISFKLEGKDTAVKALHAIKAPAPIVVIPCGNVKTDNDSQRAKA